MAQSIHGYYGLVQLHLSYKIELSSIWKLLSIYHEPDYLWEGFVFIWILWFIIFSASTFYEIGISLKNLKMASWWKWLMCSFSLSLEREFTSSYLIQCLMKLILLMHFIEEKLFWPIQHLGVVELSFLL